MLDWGLQHELWQICSPLLRTDKRGLRRLRIFYFILKNSLLVCTGLVAVGRATQKSGWIQADVQVNLQPAPRSIYNKSMCLLRHTSACFLRWALSLGGAKEIRNTPLEWKNLNKIHPKFAQVEINKSNNSHKQPSIAPVEILPKQKHP